MKKKATLVLRVLLGLLFLLVGGAKLTATLQTVEFFTAIGWGQWFRYLTGVLDVIGAVLLFVPRWSFYGATTLVCTVGLATVLCVIRLHQNPSAPLVLTMLAATVMWLTRPQQTKDR